MNKINSFYPNLGMSWATVAIWLACSVAIGLPVAIISEITKIDFAGNSWITLACYIIPFICTAGFIYFFQYSEKPETASVAKNIPVIIFPLLLIFTPLVAFLIEPLTALISNVTTNLFEQFFKTIFNIELNLTETITRLLEQVFKADFATCLMVVIAAPICEEWLCRGVITKGLLRHGSPLRAILWSAFIFAVIHMNPWQAVPAFILGMLLGYVYWKTRSLIPCIFIHFVNNGLSFLLMSIFPETDINASTQDLIGNLYWIIYATALAHAIPLGYLLYKILNKEKVRK